MSAAGWAWVDGSPLTRRQRACLALTAQGLTHANAGLQLDMSEMSVANALLRARHNLHVTSTAAAIRVCQTNGWLEVDIRFPLDAHADPALTDAQRDYVRAFDRAAVGDRSPQMNLALDRLAAVLGLGAGAARR